MTAQRFGQKLSLAEFIVALSELADSPDYQWGLYTGEIRANWPAGLNHIACPITAVCQHRIGMFYLEQQAYAAAARLGLSSEDAMLIIAAADRETTAFTPLREDLLRVLHLATPSESRL